MQPRMPVYFLCHGGGPWPYMQGPFREMMRWLEASLQDVPRQLPCPPRAILMASAHWEAPAFMVTSAEAPSMVYDFSGFPASTYRVRYPAPGSPELAARAVQLLTDAGLPTGADAVRGLDHGSYSVLQPMFPRADVPVVQISLHASLDPGLHLRAGAALASLRDEGVLIVGSGMSSHDRTPEIAQQSAQFDAWLRAAVNQTREPRNTALSNWEKAPHARNVHSREEHLLPLMLAAGAAGDDVATCIYAEQLMSTYTVSSFRFGGNTAASAFDRHAEHHPALA